MAPLTRSRADDAGVPGELQATYYAQRASAGLIISEATNISAQGKGYIRTPGIWTPEQVEGWKLTTKAVHAKGGRIFLQLWHVGRVSHRDLQPGGVLPVAPSAVRAEGQQAYTYDGFKPLETPRALETAEIAGIVADYAHARAVRQGCGLRRRRDPLGQRLPAAAVSLRQDQQAHGSVRRLDREPHAHRRRGRRGGGESVGRRSRRHPPRRRSPGLPTSAIQIPSRSICR